MSENIIKSDSPTLIFNGGDPLEGCPESWEEAKAWEAEANSEASLSPTPMWKFDCGFKLDFDGPLVEVLSRFYPPKTGYGPKWDGSLTIYVRGVKTLEKGFECDTLSQLKKEVEEWVNGLEVHVNLTPSSDK